MKKKKEGWTKKTEEEKNLTLTKQMVQNRLYWGRRCYLLTTNVNH